MTANVPQKISPVTLVCQTINQKEATFKAALPPHISVEKFMRVAITAIQNTPDLQKIASASPASRNSIFTACSKAAADGLLPDGREGAIVAFNRKVSAKGQPDKYELQAQWMPMVEGLRKMVRNSGEISNISVQVVRENDHFDYEMGDHEFIKHKPALKARGKIIGAYSIATLKDGEKSREYMDIDEIEAVKSRSKSAKFGPWTTDYSEMCRKTVFRRHYKSLPKSTDLDKVIEHDEDYATDPSLAAFTASPAAHESHAEVDFGNHEEVQQPAAKTPAKRQSKRATDAMKQADVTEVQPAAKKTFAKGDTINQPPQEEEEVDFEEGDDGRDHQEQQYEEEETDVV